MVNGFLLETVTTAKFIGRGDFWRAQHWLAHDLRPRLLRLLEWHAAGKNTWYAGRFMDDWADARALLTLPQTFARFDRMSLVRAVRESIDLFGGLGEEAASRLGYTYPAAAHNNVTALIESIFLEQWEARQWTESRSQRD